jgi:hypothetical protein
MRLRISQFAAAIPIIGYLLIWSAPLQHFLASHPTLKAVEFLSVLERLKFIYAGSIFLAAAWCVYLIRCPKVIQRHPSEEDFLIETSTISDFFSHPRFRPSAEQEC